MPVLSEHETWHRSRSPSPACLECSISALSRPRDGATYLDYDSDSGSDLISQTGTNMCVCELFGATLEASNPMTVVTDVTDRKHVSRVDMSRTGVAFWIRI